MEVEKTCQKITIYPARELSEELAQSDIIEVAELIATYSDGSEKSLKEYIGQQYHISAIVEEIAENLNIARTLVRIEYEY